MAQEDRYSSSADGRIYLGGPSTAGSSWSTVRNTVTGVSINNTGTTSQGPFAIMFSGKGADFFDVSRYFLYFDMSSFPTYSTIDSAEIELYRHANGGVSVIAVRHDAPSVHINNAEFVFFPSHDPASGDSMTAYSSANTGGTGTNTFTLNATAITELTACIEGSGNGGVGTSSFEVAIVSNLDYTNTEPSDRSELGLSFRTQEYSDTSSDPILSVTYSTAAAVTHNATFFGANF